MKNVACLLSQTNTETSLGREVKYPNQAKLNVMFSIDLYYSV